MVSNNVKHEMSKYNIFVRCETAKLTSRELVLSEEYFSITGSAILAKTLREEVSMATASPASHLERSPDVKCWWWT
mgnify:CR=1 FL=1